ncbi:MAG: transketolase [Armatimonadetes bacterium]|nr:MAG: transketolase [Armatimonadota bacterium]
MDAVQAANSGHPGLPMGCAAIGYSLFAHHLRYDPQAPKWFNRDRFVLSAGHGSMLLYAYLYLTGFDLTLEDLKAFRQLGSKTPGHPENTLTPGVEMATGPLGQGFGTAVGMAIAEEKLRKEFGPIVDHYTYCLCSDGDIMEGISHEAASLAGHLGLGRLIYVYDSNRITIDGPTDLSFSEDVMARFEAYGWHVLECDGLSVAEVDESIEAAKAEAERPTLIVCHTIIGYGSPNKGGRASSHGAPLGEEEVRLAKQRLGLDPDEKFAVPDDVLQHMRQIGARWRDERIRSEEALDREPELKRRLTRSLPEGWQRDLPTFAEPVATRAASGKVLESLKERIPELVGGSADLGESTHTLFPGETPFSAADREGDNLYYGVREHAMAAAINGMNLHGGLRAFGGTFLVFSDYMRPAIRLAALMEVPSVFVFTHDSIGLGEDGPTHQPIEHLASLRAIPNLQVFRPADGAEVVAAWQVALLSDHTPTAIVLTRQKVPQVGGSTEGAKRGGYVLRDWGAKPDTVLLGTGSEVSILLEAAEILAQQGMVPRVISLPCWELFEEQEEAYRENVLLPEIRRRVSLEAAATLGWERYVLGGRALGMKTFGASAPYQDLYEHFGLTAEAVVSAALSL